MTKKQKQMVVQIAVFLLILLFAMIGESLIDNLLTTIFGL